MRVIIFSVVSLFGLIAFGLGWITNAALETDRPVHCIRVPGGKGYNGGGDGGDAVFCGRNMKIIGGAGGGGGFDATSKPKRNL